MRYTCIVVRVRAPHRGVHGHLEKRPCCCKSHTLEQNRVQKRAKTRVQKRPPSPSEHRGSDDSTRGALSSVSILQISRGVGGGGPLHDVRRSDDSTTGGDDQRSDVKLCKHSTNQQRGWGGGRMREEVMIQQSVMMIEEVMIQQRVR